MMAHEQRPSTLKANIKQVAHRSAGGTPDSLKSAQVTPDTKALREEIRAILDEDRQPEMNDPSLTDQIETLITNKLKEERRQTQVKCAAELSSLDQQVMLLKAKLKTSEQELLTRIEAALPKKIGSGARTGHDHVIDQVKAILKGFKNG